MVKRGALKKITCTGDGDGPGKEPRGKWINQEFTERRN